MFSPLPPRAPLLFALLGACTPPSSGAADAGIGTTDGGADDGGAATDAPPCEPRGPTRILYVKGGVATLVDGDGSNERALYAELLRDYTAIELSRDGSTVAFCARGADDTTNLYGGPVDQVERLVDTAFCQDARPSPDGSVIAWVSRQEAFPPVTLRLYALDGSEMPGDGAFGSTQMWTPTFISDERIAVVVSAAGPSGELWLVEADNGDVPVTIPGEIERGFQEVPGGGVIVVDDERVLSAIDASGGRQDYIDLSDDLDDLPFGQVEDVTVSPDGSLLAFTGRTGPLSIHRDIFVYRLEDKELVRVTEDDTHDSQPRFGGAGELLYWRAADKLVRAPLEQVAEAEPEVVVTGSVVAGYDIAWVDSQTCP